MYRKQKQIQIPSPNESLTGLGFVSMVVKIMVIQSKNRICKYYEIGEDIKEVHFNIIP